MKNHLCSTPSNKSQWLNGGHSCVKFIRKPFSFDWEKTATSHHQANTWSSRTP